MEKLKGLKGLFRRSQRVQVGPRSVSSSGSRSTSRSKSSSKSRESTASRRNKQRTRRNRITQLNKKLQEERDFQEYEMEDIRKLAVDSDFSYSNPIREEARNKLGKANKKVRKLQKKAERVEVLKDDLDIFEKIEDAPNLSKAQKRTMKKKWNALWKKWRSSEYGTSEYRRLEAEVDDFEEMVNSGNIHM